MRQREIDRGGTLPRQCVVRIPRPDSPIPDRCTARVEKRGLCTAHLAGLKEEKASHRAFAAANLADIKRRTELRREGKAVKGELPTRRTLLGLVKPLPLHERKRYVDDQAALARIWDRRAA